MRLQSYIPLEQVATEAGAEEVQSARGQQSGGPGPDSRLSRTDRGGGRPHRWVTEVTGGHRALGVVLTGHSYIRCVASLFEDGT